MSESQMWSRFRPLILHRDPQRVEHKFHKGFPDVNYVEGWVELKQIAFWPSGKQTIVQVKHYTEEQRVWGVRRSRAGGKCHLLLHVSSVDEWLLFESQVAAAFLGRVPKSELLNQALKVFIGLPNQNVINSVL